MTEQTKVERIRAALHCDSVDRVPISLWRHFPHQDDKPESLAKAHVEFQRKYDLDLVKVTPVGFSAVDDWGTKVGRPVDAYGVPTVLEWAIGEPRDWARIEVLPPTQGRLGQEVNALRLIGESLGGEVPYIQTIFSPLTNARKLAGEDVFRHLREQPGMLHRALEVITETTIRYVEACTSVGGANGVFFATQCADCSKLSEDEYSYFGRAYDLQVLTAIRNLCEIVILHLHGSHVMFTLFLDYPVDGINWHDRVGGPSLAEARRTYDGCLIGGLSADIDFMLSSQFVEIQVQVEDAISQTGGRGLIVAPGCVLPVKTPETHLFAARRAVEGRSL